MAKKVSNASSASTRLWIGAQKIDRRWFAQYALFGYLAQFLQVPYATLFQDKTETQIGSMLSAFAYNNCVPNQPLVDVLAKHLK